MGRKTARLQAVGPDCLAKINQADDLIDYFFLGRRPKTQLSASYRQVNIAKIAPHLTYYCAHVKVNK